MARGTPPERWQRPLARLRRMSKVSIVDQVGKSDDVHPRFNPEEAQHVHDAELKGGGSQQRSPKKRNQNKISKLKLSVN